MIMVQHPDQAEGKIGHPGRCGQRIRPFGLSGLLQIQIREVRRVAGPEGRGGHMEA